MESFKQACKRVLVKSVKTGYQSAFGAWMGLTFVTPAFGIDVDQAKVQVVALVIGFLSGFASSLNNAILEWTHKP